MEKLFTWFSVNMTYTMSVLGILVVVGFLVFLFRTAKGKGLRKKLGELIRSHNKIILRVIAVLVVIICAWYGFLRLVGNPPIDTTPALIMVWASVVILIVALFPKIFDRIKRLKLKDFEIELQETVKGVVPTEYLSISDSEFEHIFSDKRGWSNLQQIIIDANNQPLRPVLLIVNLKNGIYISIPMLYVYLTLLETINISTLVLFISTMKRYEDIQDISIDSFIGVISGKLVLLDFQKRFPKLLERQSEFSSIIGNILNSRIPPDNSSIDNTLEQWHRHIWGDNEELGRRSERLSVRDVERWFGKQLNTHSINLNLSSADLRTLREATQRGDDYIVVRDESSLKAIISLCKLTRNISRRVILEIED